MSFGFGFALPAIRTSAGGNNPFNQLGPTLDLTFAGVPTDPLGVASLTDYTLNTDFIVPQYQIAAQYAIWENDVGLVSKTFSQIITFTRASTATYFDSAGVLQSAAINAPRFDYDPDTLAARGFLIEEARTNSIRNNTMQGAVAGTPGTLPTNWSIANSAGLSTEVVGTGIESGVTYIDLRIFGTTTGTIFALNFEPTTQIPALQNQTWTGSFFAKYSAGSLANVGALSVTIIERNSAGSLITQSTSSNTLLNTNLAINRLNNTYTLPTATAAYVSVRFDLTLTSSAAIDITLRIGLPQLEQGAFATSAIPTTTTALTRSRDQTSVNTLSPWFNATEGTLYAEGVTNRPYGVAAGGQMAQISDGTANNRMWIAQGSTTATNTVVSTSGPNVVSMDYGPAPSANLLNKSAFAYATDDFAGCANGGTVQTDSSGGVPSVTTLYIGISSSLSAASIWNGYLRRITYYPRRLSNAELQAITA